MKPAAPNSFVTQGYLAAFIVVTSLFFIWAIASSMNDILIKQFQKALDLSRGQSSFIQFAFYLGYFFMALPAGLAMQRLGYKTGILIGLGLYALGATLFYPAAIIQQYWFFLIALFVIASGITFLETAANPFVALMGDHKRAAQRLNLAQSFNGLGAATAPFLGGIFILSGIEYSDTQLAGMSAEAVTAFRAAELKAVQVPYLVMAGVVTAIAIVIIFIKMPPIEGIQSQSNHRIKNLLANKQLTLAIVAQFFYVGAQVCIWSFFINFCQAAAPGLNEKTAAQYLSVSLLLFMFGRFAGTALMGLIPANRLLLIFAVINIILCIVAANSSGLVAIVALGLTSLFMSIMFPTIFALGLQGQEKQSGLASSLIIMAVIGGALMPLVMGFIGDHSLRVAMGVPALCFCVIALFALGHIKGLMHARLQTE